MDSISWTSILKFGRVLQLLLSCLRLFAAQNLWYDVECHKIFTVCHTVQVLGSGLTIVTIGETSCLTIISRDAYSNWKDAIWAINITSFSGNTSLMRHSSTPAFEFLVMCYPSKFRASQVGELSVFVSNSAQEVPVLVGTPNKLLYVHNMICAARCVVTGSGLCAGECDQKRFLDLLFIIIFCSNSRSNDKLCDPNE